MVPQVEPVVVTEVITVPSKAAPSKGAWKPVPMKKKSMPITPSQDRPRIPVTMHTPKVPSQTPPRDIKATVQNFRNILIDIEKQQALQTQQLQKLTQ